MDRASAEPQVELRPARSDDVPAVLALWRVAGLFPSTNDDVESVRGLIAWDAEALLVAEIDGEIVGSVCGTWDGWRATSTGLPSTPVTDEKASR
jgi:ribosomal protein S18 acetylase RimI-like enzyme